MSLSRIAKYGFTFGAAALVFMTALAGTALAAGAVTPDEGSLLDLAKPIFDAVMSGQWAFAAAAALVLMVALARRYGGARFPFLRTDAGGTALTVLGSFGGAVATALTAGAAMSGALMWTALGVAIAAAGGYTILKKLVIDPLLRPLAARAPAWLQPVFALLFWVFERQSPEEKATEAGVLALKANPPSGVAGVTGSPTELL